MNKDENDELAEKCFWKYQHDIEAIDRAIAKLQPAYRQALNGIWIANGGASLATLSFTATTIHELRSHMGLLLCAIVCFVLGLVSMAIGTVWWLIKERRWLAYMDKHEPPFSVLDVPAGLAKSPTERAGLSLKDPRTTAAVISGTLFVIGCGTGLIALLLG